MANFKQRPAKMTGLPKHAQISERFGCTDNIDLGQKLSASSLSKKRSGSVSKTHAPNVSAYKGTVRLPIEPSRMHFPHPKWDGSFVQKRFHSGRTDYNYGHHVFTNPTNNRGDALGTYHFHHTQGPHMPCCRTGVATRQAASIINPYTGREINLGRPYVFQNQNYFSVNLVARALTIWDTFGASLSLFPVLPPFFSVGGSFSACNLGESTSENGTLGERFSFTYPTLPVIGTIRNNTFFNADGNRGGRLELLCHTTQAELDPYRCYAYTSLETLREYMLGGNFFTEFTPNMPANVWSFTHSVPLARITSPSHNENFSVGDTLIVRASVQDVREAALTINGRSIQARTGLSGRNFEFDGYQLTSNDVGNLSIGVTARNGQGIAVSLPVVRVNIFATPSVQILTPQDGDIFTVGDSIVVKAQVQNATLSELAVGSSHRQTITHSAEQQRINFNPHTLTADNIGDLEISVTSRNEQDVRDTNNIQLQVANSISQHPLRALTFEEVESLMAHPNFVFEWDLPSGYSAAKGSTVSYSGTGSSNPVRVVNILGRSVSLYRWIFLQEPGITSNIIGVPVIENLSDNGGLDTGNRDNIITILGGVSQQRRTQNVPIAVLDSNGIPFRVLALRTVLKNIVQAAYEDVAREVPEYRMNYATAGWDRLPPNSRTHNHPNAVAIDVNGGQNGQTEPNRRQEPGINSVSGFHYINSLDVEQIMERHGIRLGYAGDTPGLTTNGFMHWSISRT